MFRTPVVVLPLNRREWGTYYQRSGSLILFRNGRNIGLVIYHSNLTAMADFAVSLLAVYNNETEIQESFGRSDPMPGIWGVIKLPERKLIE